MNNDLRRERKPHAAGRRRAPPPACYQASTDRLTQATGAEAKHYANDAYGNRTWAGPTAYAGSSSLVYDESNRLREARDPVTLAVLGQYTYDALGRRVILPYFGGQFSVRSFGCSSYSAGVR